MMYSCNGTAIYRGVCDRRPSLGRKSRHINSRLYDLAPAANLRTRPPEGGWACSFSSVSIGDDEPQTGSVPTPRRGSDARSFILIERLRFTPRSRCTARKLSDGRWSQGSHHPRGNNSRARLATRNVFRRRKIPVRQLCNADRGCPPHACARQHRMAVSGAR